jgi:hypothetical protein
MKRLSAHDGMVAQFTRLVLRVGLWLPILYYGLQLIAAPFYPGYNFLSQPASDLGASTFRYGQWFSLGILLFGALLLMAGLGIALGLHQRGTHPLLTGFALVTISACGVASLWAGAVPLPDPGHGGPAWLTVGMVLTPLALTLAMWGEARLRPLLLGCVLLILALIPLVSGALGISIQGYGGLLQRLLALATFGSISLAAYGLLPRATPAESPA